MTCFLRDTTSYHRLMETLQLFSRFSNLQVNNDKTEIFAIGGQKLDQKNFHHEVRTSIKFVGIVFNYNTSLDQYSVLSNRVRLPQYDLDL